MPDFLLDANRMAPFVDAAAVTPSDSDDLATLPTRALYIGVTGDVKVDMASGVTATFKAVPVGVLRVQVRKVYETDTTATDILALY